MKARKIGATLLAAVLAGSLLAGCGGESESTSNTGSVSNSGSTSESSTSDTSESFNIHFRRQRLHVRFFRILT